ncbi:MAG: hypothetical protein KC731_02410 [Myxococcales bacterium]|nr:hypothetical protein [Myxococcales bacterium]
MLRFGVVAAAALLVQGCTVIVAGSEEQCTSDADCTSRGFAGAVCEQQVCVEPKVEEDPVWGCLGKVVEPEPDPTKTLELPMRLAYAIGGSPVSVNTVVDVCDKLDLNCTSTDPKYPKGLHPDNQGNVLVEIPEGFDGFVQIIGPDLVDTRVYVGRPIVEAPSVKEVQLFSPDDFSLLSTLAGQDPDPTRGTAIVLVVDCSDVAAGGVRLETPNADMDTIPFYLINQSPTMPPTATATDKDGFGGFFNLPASEGTAVVRAFRDEDDAYVGESSFQVLANTISFVQVRPTPQ